MDIHKVVEHIDITLSWLRRCFVATLSDSDVEALRQHIASTKELLQEMRDCIDDDKYSGDTADIWGYDGDHWG